MSKFITIKFVSVIIVFLFSSCIQVDEKVDVSYTDFQKEFLSNYKEYCGKAYKGRSVMVNLGENHPLINAELLMIIEKCIDGEVRIKFYVNDDRSRTWILIQTKQGLHLSHDHRYEDGTQYPNNWYGGYADESGNSLIQFFPADHRTILDRPAREINVWSKEFDKENKLYYYRLYLEGDLRYEAEFDLSNPAKIERINNEN